MYVHQREKKIPNNERTRLRMRVLRLDAPDSIPTSDEGRRGGIIDESVDADGEKLSGTPHSCRKDCSSKSERWRQIALWNLFCCIISSESGVKIRAMSVPSTQDTILES